MGLIILACSCKSTKNNSRTKLDISKITLGTGCPDRATCVAEIKPNTRIDYKTETSTGKLNPEFMPDSTQNVVKIEFSVNQDKKVMDAQYRELVYFEVPKNVSELSLQDEALQNVHFLFGRFCFCARETVGYFKVNSGKLKFKDGEFSIHVKNGKAPQKLRSISGTYIVD